MSIGLETIRFRLTVTQVRDHYYGSRGRGRDLDFQAMSPSWTLRTIHFSNFKTKKILMEVLGNLEICNISYLMFVVFERLFITVVIPGSGNDRFFEPRMGQEVAMNENI